MLQEKSVVAVLRCGQSASLACLARSETRICYELRDQEWFVQSARKRFHPSAFAVLVRVFVFVFVSLHLVKVRQEYNVGCARLRSPQVLQPEYRDTTAHTEFHIFRNTCTCSSSGFLTPRSLLGMLRQSPYDRILQIFRRFWYVHRPS